jgi:hypothetical protein
MTRAFLAHDVAEVTGLSGQSYGGNMPGQVFDMSPGDAKALVAAGGALATLSGHASRGVGYRCTTCGFGSYFTACSRPGCEGVCVRE